MGWRSAWKAWGRIKVMAFPHWATNNHQSQTAVTSHHLTAWVTESQRVAFLLFRLNIIYIEYFFYFARDIRSELIEYVLPAYNDFSFFYNHVLTLHSNGLWMKRQMYYHHLLHICINKSSFNWSPSNKFMLLK